MRTAKNAQQVTIYENPERFEAHTCVAQLGNGDVVVTFCETRAKQHEDFDSVYMVRSRDSGWTFDPSTKTAVWQQTSHFGSDIPLITQISDGTLLMNHLVTSFHGQKGITEDMGWQSEEGLMRAKGAEGTWISRSHDNGASWEPGYKVNSEPLRWTMPADSILELPNGTLLMAVNGQLYARRLRTDQEPLRSALLRSDNGGDNWEHWSTIAFDPAGIISFDEPAIALNNDGVLVCMMRTEHLPRFRHQHMWMAYSRDEGESWSRPEATNLWGYPADLTLLSDGRMLATYGHRRGNYGVHGVISPGGLTWDATEEFVIRAGTIPPQSATPDFYHIGYPHSVQLADGSIFTVDHAFTEKPPYMQYVVGVHWDL